MNIFEGVVVQLMIATWNDNLFEGKERTSISIIVPVYKNFICAYVIYSVMWAFLRMYVHLIEATSRSSSSWVQHQRIQEIKKIVTLNIFTVIHNTTCFALHNTKNNDLRYICALCDEFLSEIHLPQPYFFSLRNNLIFCQKGTIVDFLGENQTVDCWLWWRWYI